MVPEQAHLIILHIKSDVCMSNNYKDTKHTSHISIRIHLIRNGEEFNLRKIVWCDGGIQ